MTRSKIILPMLLAIAACSPKSAPDPKVAEGWARATAPGQTSGAAYLKIENDGGAADRLVSIKTDRASMAMLHVNDAAGGMARMRMVDALDLPPGETIELKPGSTHVMLEGLSAPLRAGDRFDLQLHFAKTGDRTVAITVVAPGSR